MRKGPSQKNVLIIIMDEIKVLSKDEKMIFVKST